MPLSPFSFFPSFLFLENVERVPQFSNFAQHFFAFEFLSFQTGFLCETVLAVLNLALVDQAGLELTEIHHLPVSQVQGLKAYATTA